MRIALQTKIDRDLALNLSELMSATGYGRRAIKRIEPPLVCGKIRLKDFWRYHAKLGVQENTITTTAASLEPPSDLLSIVARLRATGRRMIRQRADTRDSDLPVRREGPTKGG